MRSQISTIVEYSSMGGIGGSGTLRITNRAGALSTIYQADTGPNVLSNPISFDNGRAQGWLEDGSYILEVSGPLFADATEYLEIVNGQAHVTHVASTTNVHGIPDTSALVTQNDIAGITDAHFTFDTQGVALGVWNIQHNLGKRPSVIVVDSSDNQVIAACHYIDNNSLTVTCSPPLSGKAYLN